MVQAYREASLSCCLSCFSSPPPPPRRTLSLHHPRACNGALNHPQPPSASLYSPPPPLQRPRFDLSPKTSPGLCSVLTPHTSSVPALPGLIRHRLLVRVHTPHTTRLTSHRRAPPVNPAAATHSVDLSSSLTAELLDWTTSLTLLRLPPPLSRDCCIHRTSYKASRASVFVPKR